MILRFAGGIEAVKIVAPVLTISIEIGKRLYEFTIASNSQNRIPI